MFKCMIYMRKIRNILTVTIAVVCMLPLCHAAAYSMKTFGPSDGLSSRNVVDIAVDPAGYVWFSAQDPETGEGGLSVLDRMHECTAPFDASDGLSSTAIADIAFEHVPEGFVDDYEYGNIWIATDSGINVLDRRGVVTTLNSRNTSLPGNTITSLFINKENTKWVSVQGKGVCCIDAEFNWGTYTVADGLCSNTILSMHEDANGNMWFGSKGRGVSFLDRDGNWLHFSSANSGLIGNYVFDIADEKPNRMWFVTSQGVSVFDGQNWMSYTARNSPLGSYVPTNVVIDGSGNKWIGTRQGGLFKLDSFGMWTRYNRDNSNLPDNAINDLVVDADGVLWVATPAGLCSLGNGMQKTVVQMPDRQFLEPSDTRLGEGVYYPFAHALMWENIGDAELEPQLSLALPSFAQQGRSWFYAAVWEDQNFRFADLDYRVEGNRRGNRRITFNGNFFQTMFFISGGILSSFSGDTLDTASRHPFPGKYPEELLGLIKPGGRIPSNDPEIKKLVERLVRPESRGDMAQTMRDIVYSKLVQHLGPIEKNIGLISEKERGEENAAIGSAKDVYYVLENRKGDHHAKARLICTLARAAGIPARIVMSIKGKTWCQVWLAGAGWISVEALYPVYDYLRPMRTYMPKVFLPEDLSIAAVSGKNDDVGNIVWNPEVKGYYVESDPAELGTYQNLSKAKLLITQFVQEETVPDNARIEIAENIYVIARQQQGQSFLQFQDKTGAAIEVFPLVFNGLSSFARVQDRLFWKFIPRRIGELLVIENLECVIP